MLGDRKYLGDKVRKLGDKLARCIEKKRKYKSKYKELNVRFKAKQP